MPAFSPAPSGLLGRVFGAPSGSATTRNYWVQAIYLDGSRSLFAGPLTVNNTPASLGGGFTSQSGISNVGTGPYVAVSWNATPGAVAYDVLCTSSTTYPTAQGNIGVVVGTNANAIADVTPASPGNSPYLLYTPLNAGYKGVARFRYDFAVDGGPIATTTLSTLGNDVIPINAIMVAGQIKVITAFVGATATIGFGTTAGSSSTSILAATAVASFTANALLNTSCTYAAAVRMTAQGQIVVTIATAVLTAGSCEGFVEYFVSTA